MSQEGSHPLDGLLRPLHYVSQRNFALLRTVKALRPLLEGTIAKAEALLRPSVLNALRAELSHIDSPSLPARKASVARLLEALKLEGVGASKIERPPREEKKKSTARRAEKIPSSRLLTPALLSLAPRSGPLSRPIQTLPGRLSPRLLSALKKRGMERVGDLLFLLPRTYEDRREMRKISQLAPGERGAVVATVRQVNDRSMEFFRGGKRRGVFRAVLADETGSLSVSYFQGGPWLKARFPIGKRLVVSGELRALPTGREMSHPEVEPFEEGDLHSLHFGRIVSIYPGFERHEQRAIRQLCARAVDGFAHSLEDPLPKSLRDRLSLLPLDEAIRRLHQVKDSDDLGRLERHQSPSHLRLAFDELFFLQLGMALRRQEVKSEPGIAFDVSAQRQAQAAKVIPFNMTSAQGRAAAQIAEDMGGLSPMHRLLQGDVGSGKTAVALWASALALLDGHQVALMAPTEILAEQLCAHAQRGLSPLGFSVGLFTASGTAKERTLRRQELAEGRIHLAVGTHALIQERVSFQRLGLVVIDEQHRFGVIQRHALMSKGVRPDTLVMTATPIPRTLAMTLYGDLEVSVIDELPPGRTPIRTQVFTQRQRKKAQALLAEELAKGRQAYVVYPLVEESEKVDLADATQGAEKMREALPGHRIGLLHGRMGSEEKAQVMAEFRSHRIDLLVCTTVVEVGVDVPNASVMVIEGAERFGLSQLHQLRGRVGRGAAASFCVLLPGAGVSREAMERLQVMEQAGDGFLIAEKDLELRGPGEFLGTRQSGLPELVVANLVRHAALLEQARQEAFAIAKVDPQLQRPEHLGLRKALDERWEGRLALAKVG